MENKKKGLNLRAIIPLATAIVSLVFIVVGLKDYGFWKAQPTPGFFPIIIAVVLLAASVACFFQIVKDKDSADVSYNRNELLVMLGAAAIILCTSLIGLEPSRPTGKRICSQVVNTPRMMAAMMISMVMIAFQGAFSTSLSQSRI